jgi:hypothetical protein
MELEGKGIIHESNQISSAWSRNVGPILAADSWSGWLSMPPFLREASTVRRAHRRTRKFYAASNRGIAPI